MAANFVRQPMFQKKLSASDINEGRVYLPTQLVKKLGLVDGTERVTVFDVQMNSSTMNFCRRCDRRAFLGKGWRDFVKEKGFRKDETVTFYVLRPQGGGRIEPTHFQIIRHKAARRAVGRFHLNKPPRSSKAASSLRVQEALNHDLLKSSLFHPNELKKKKAVDKIALSFSFDIMLIHRVDIKERKTNF
ncbi:hypothetical protein FH972_018814 [Carpinus fangiana]|uniref:TF-B3 domain-containing protein n=1 Tax=Carpinus fangiana TaxID=176857 RepID=A0A5N6RNI0_9ROSI|nr:hypothetical protein FH972_018814 [Carpinus fangiana]